MEFFRFIKWWWNKLNYSEQVLSIIAMIALVSVVTAVIFQNIFLFALTFLGGAVTVLISVLCHAFYEYVRDTWRSYQAEKNEEAAEIISRLQGDRTRGFFE